MNLETALGAMTAGVTASQIPVKLSIDLTSRCLVYKALRCCVVSELTLSQSMAVLESMVERTGGSFEARLSKFVDLLLTCAKAELGELEADEQRAQDNPHLLMQALPAALKGIRLLPYEKAVMTTITVMRRAGEQADARTPLARAWSVDLLDGLIGLETTFLLEKLAND